MSTLDTRKGNFLKGTRIWNFSSQPSGHDACGMSQILDFTELQTKKWHHHNTDPDEMPHVAASHLGLYYFLIKCSIYVIRLGLSVLTFDANLYKLFMIIMFMQDNVPLKAGLHGMFGQRRYSTYQDQPVYKMQTFTVWIGSESPYICFSS